jgi:Ca2+-binding EF-hand superfamily protein
VTELKLAFLQIDPQMKSSLPASEICKIFKNLGQVGNTPGITKLFVNQDEKMNIYKTTIS